MNQIQKNKIDLNNIGIKNETIYHNLSYEELFNHETDSSLDVKEKGIVTSQEAVTINTGKFTGRSPKDKYIVKQPDSSENIWWSEEGSDNKAISEVTWNHLENLATTQLSNKTLYIMDGYCGANKESRLAVRLVTEIAWQAHFFKNMFIEPTKEELESFEPEWTILNSCKTSCKNHEEYDLRSEVFIAFNIKKRTSLIGGTWYGGEMKKGIFSIMNYFLPLKNIGALHCSANEGKKGDTALFFGLSGTGKTTLSTDPKRSLIGDDEHGWDNDGIFNFEGGCYAKTINLCKESEPDIYKAIKRNALLENVVLNEDNSINFKSNTKTENTRVSYPISHIENIVKPYSKGTHPKTIIFLTCDAYGVLPPVSKLTKEQAMYQYLSGYTAKVAGTELGVKEPTATFSACFGAPFLLLHPIKYAEILGQKIEEHGSNAYLVNTGWIGGAYGVGNRISIKDTRAIIDAILDGSIENQENYHTTKTFQLTIPLSLPNVDNSILLPQKAWADQDGFHKTVRLLAEKFSTNFKKFSSTEFGKELEKVGPRIK